MLSGTLNVSFAQAPLSLESRRQGEDSSNKEHVPSTCPPEHARLDSLDTVADGASEETPAAARSDWYDRPKSISANRAQEPVDYAHPLSYWGDESAPLPSWLLFGVEQRTRYEYFDDSYLFDLQRYQPILMRSRAFLGVREIIDPVRFGVEFMDSRAFNNLDRDRVQDVNEYDFLQAYGELYFKDLLGPGQPMRIQAGRLAVDYIDRRLRSRNGFRNTTNAFDGFRLRFGERESRWELDIFAAQPVVIRPRQPDRPNEEQWFYGVVGAWRGWSPWVTLEPYYFVLDEDLKGWRAADTELHALGLRAYGDIGRSGFDYDVNGTLELGKNQGSRQEAVATHLELGYTFEHAWKPRLAGWFNYASGDKNPSDNLDQRFDRFFGSSHAFYGFTDYFTLDNLMQPAVELRLHPDDDTSVSLLYRANWLASKRDGWVRGNRSDPTGESGRFIGQEIDLFFRRKFTEHLTIEIGYAHFLPGAFVRNTGDSPDSDRLYIQTILRF